MKQKANRVEIVHNNQEAVFELIGDDVYISIGKENISFPMSELSTLFLTMGNDKFFNDYVGEIEARGNLYKRQHRVKLTKNLKKGEEMVVNCDIFVPQIVTDGKANMKQVDLVK